MDVLGFGAHASESHNKKIKNRQKNVKKGQRNKIFPFTEMFG